MDTSLIRLIRIFRRLTILAAFLLIVLLAQEVAGGFIIARSETPAAACGSINVACPDLDDPAADYIASVTATPREVVILLTDAGLDKARECGGADVIAQLTETLYDIIPDSEKAEFQLDWTSQTLTDEIYGHAFFNRLSGDLGGLGSVYERSNPINIVFADYGGPGEITADARSEQAIFKALGDTHRLAC